MEVDGQKSPHFDGSDGFDAAMDCTVQQKLLRKIVLERLDRKCDGLDRSTGFPAALYSSMDSTRWIFTGRWILQGLDVCFLSQRFGLSDKRGT